MNNLTEMISRHKKTGRYFILWLIIVISSCSRVLHPVEMTDAVSEEDLFRGIVVTDSAGIGDIPWHELFTDTLLQSIIENTLENNPDLSIATARIEKAEAVFRQSKAEFFPSFNAGFSGSYQNAGGDDFNPTEVYQVYGSTSWEAGIWGKLRSSKRAALATLLASEAYRRAVITQLVASVASNYYVLLALDAQLEITQQTLEKRISNVETMELLKANDVITGADLVLSHANRYSAEVTIPDLKQNIYETENILSLLMGRPPGQVKRSSLSEQQLSPDLSKGIPANILANRPDVREAEFRLRFYYENVRFARSFFYPSLTITARGGLTETSFQTLFNTPSLFINIAGGLLQPVFNLGINRQRLRSASADLDEYSAVFTKTLLEAGEEVVNAMHNYETASQKIAIREKQVEYLERSVEYTTELLKYTSTTNYIDVLTAEVNLLSAQLNGVNDRLEQLLSVVALYRSLGGGWQDQ